jgi:hypothetical protein
VRIARHREGSGNAIAETAGCLGGFLLATPVLFQTPSPMLDQHRFLGSAVFEQSLLAPTPRFLLSETDLLGHSLCIGLEETPDQWPHHSHQKWNRNWWGSGA